MKRKIGICIIMALLMITSAFTFSTVTAESSKHPGQIVFEKKVWDKELNDWVDEVEAELGQILKFKLEVTYHMDEFYSGNPITFTNITISDDWAWQAYCFDYVEGSASTEPTEVFEDVGFIWDLEGLVLSDNDSYNITFELEIVEIDPKDLVNVNWARLNGTEGDMYYHLKYDNAVITLRYGLFLEKMVWDPDLNEWVDELSQVKSCDNINFQITVTYFGPDDITCLKVEDFLPGCCLEYVGNEEFTYPDPELFEDPEIINTSSYVLWNWSSDKLFNLTNGQSIVIEFEAKVINYCYTEVNNFVEAEGWSCGICNHLFASDSTTIICTPPPTTFEKKIKNTDTGKWVEEIHTFVGETIRFQLKYIYYGNEVYNDTRIIDELPSVLEYAGNANIQETYVSDDNKTIWWNLTDDVEDCDVLIIEFDALVLDATPSCCPAINIAELLVYDEDAFVAGYTDTANLTADNCFPFVKNLTGPFEGETGDLLVFKAKGDNSCGSDLEYWFDWGDGNNSGWIGPFASDVEINKSKTYDNAGVYFVKVKVRDEHLAESNWSEPLHEINITEGEPEPETPDIEIEFNQMIGFKSITPTIVKNIEGNITDAFIKMSVQGGALIHIYSEMNWTTNLTTNDTLIIFNQFGIIPLIGFLDVEVNVTIPGYTESFVATTTAFKIGPIVITRQPYVILDE